MEINPLEPERSGINVWNSWSYSASPVLLIHKYIPTGRGKELQSMKEVLNLIKNFSATTPYDTKDDRIHRYLQTNLHELNPPLA